MVPIDSQVVPGALASLSPLYQQISIEITDAWLSNHFNCLAWDVITHPCPKFNGGLTKPPLNLGHG